MNRLDKIKEVIADQLGVDFDDVKLDSVLRSDLGADSLDVIELIMAFEEEFDIEISDEDAEKCQTVADVVALLEKLQPE